MTPLVAVALPVYNGEAYLQHAIDALRAQTERRWTAVVVDNASTDATAEIARRAAAADSRVRYARNPTNLGANGNFNRSMALALATGAPFAAWTSHDDAPHPGWLAACLGALAARPEAVGAHSAIRLVDGDGAPYPFSAARGGFEAPDGLWAWTPDAARALGDGDLGRRFLHLLETKLGQWMTFGVFRSGALAAVRPFAMPGVEDAVCAELVLRGPMAFVPEPLFDYRHHARSARHLSRRDYIEYETGVRPEGLLLPSGGRAASYAAAVARAPLSRRDRARAWAALARFAVGPRRFRNLVVPGPDNYLGIGS